jgi:hypothetical protein
LVAPGAVLVPGVTADAPKQMRLTWLKPNKVK